MGERWLPSACTWLIDGQVCQGFSLPPCSLSTPLASFWRSRFSPQTGRRQYTHRRILAIREGRCVRLFLRAARAIPCCRTVMSSLLSSPRWRLPLIARTPQEVPPTFAVIHRRSVSTVSAGQIRFSLMRSLTTQRVTETTPTETAVELFFLVHHR